MTTIAPFSGSQYGKNSERCEYKDESPCCLCGKSTKDDGSLYVHVTDGGSRFATKEEHESGESLGGGDMGCFPVGASCAKKLRKAGVYVFKMET